ncbi:hypothetical protein J6590_018190 [Homalodisca vitripennis]|nr:hypothetical protein J6590_018190 [Homalodisca vitripennis]
MSSDESPLQGPPSVTHSPSGSPLFYCLSLDWTLCSSPSTFRDYYTTPLRTLLRHLHITAARASVHLWLTSVSLPLSRLVTVFLTIHIPQLLYYATANFASSSPQNCCTGTLSSSPSTLRDYYTTPLRTLLRHLHRTAARASIHLPFRKLEDPGLFFLKLGARAHVEVKCTRMRYVRMYMALMQILHQQCDSGRVWEADKIAQQLSVSYCDNPVVTVSLCARWHSAVS